MTSLDLGVDYVNDAPFCEWASIFTIILRGISTPEIIPSREWACIFAKILWVIKHTINYGPIREWVYIFA